jgi:hypothetical protein
MWARVRNIRRSRWPPGGKFQLQNSGMMPRPRSRAHAAFRSLRGIEAAMDFHGHVRQNLDAAETALVNAGLPWLSDTREAMIPA